MTSLYRIRDGVYATQPEHRDQLEYEIDEKLAAVLAYLEALYRFHKDDGLGDLVYTSVFRDAPASTHHTGRAVDVRIFHPDRGFECGEIGDGFSEHDAGWVADALNDVFGPWEGNDGKPHKTAIIHGEGLNRHIHLQVPDRPWR